MALLTGHVHLQNPGIATGFALILPEGDAPKPHKSLWLLGDAGEAYDRWVRHTDIERLAGRHGLAVVMLEGQHSNYADMVHGPRWQTYITQALPDYLQMHFSLSAGASDRLVLGYGMGGHGALKLALQTPRAFSAACVAGMQADLFEKAPADEAHAFWMEARYGDANAQQSNRKDNPFALLQAAAAAGNATPLYLSDRESSKTAHAMRTLYARAQAGGLPVHWLKASAADVWAYREEMLRAFLAAVA
jgi:S-formylglutathione hydrolase FrmB